MSIKIMTAVWESPCEDPQTLLLLLALADWANEQGECWPSLPVLAAKTRQSERNCRLHLRRLETLEVLERIEHRGRNHTNLYVINLQNLQNLQASLPVLQVKRPENLQVATSKPATIVAPNPSLDPSVRETPKNSLTTFESLHGAGNAVSPPCPLPSSAPGAVASKKPLPISDTEWPGLRQALLDFQFPLAQLDDNNWWNSISYTCNDPELSWLIREFARMEAWLGENPKKRPTTRWKSFVRGWLERGYEKERKARGTQTIRHTR